MESYLETFLPTLQVSKPSLLIATTSMVHFLRDQMPSKLENIFSGTEILSDKDILS